VDSIVTRFRKMTRSLFPQVEELLRLLLVVPAPSAGAERSFSLLRRIKSYLRSTMPQRRLNHVCMLNAYPDRVDMQNVNTLMQLFVFYRRIVVSPYRRIVFGRVE